MCDANEDFIRENYGTYIEECSGAQNSFMHVILFTIGVACAPERVFRHLGKMEKYEVRGGGSVLLCVVACTYTCTCLYLIKLNLTEIKLSNGVIGIGCMNG